MDPNRSNPPRPNRTGSPAAVDAAERARLLRRAWQLVESREYAETEVLLQALPAAVLEEEPELGYLLATAWFRLGKVKPLLQLLPRLAEPARRSSNPALARMHENLQGIALLSTGDLDGAESHFQRALEDGSRAGDLRFLAKACNNLSIISLIRCRWEEGITYLQRALAVLHRHGEQRLIGSVHHNLGMCYRQLGLFGESDSHFEHAYRIFRVHGSEDEISGVEHERALLHSHQGDLRLAEGLARHALERVMASGRTRDRGEVLRVLGIIALQRGDREAAQAHLDQSLEIARATHNPLLEAEVLEELAVLRRDVEEAAVAGELVEEAARLYEQLGSSARAALARERASLAPARHSVGR